MHPELILNMGIFVFFQILQKIFYRAVLDYIREHNNSNLKSLPPFGLGFTNLEINI